jgi:hypothetical protein
MSQQRARKIKDDPEKRFRVVAFAIVFLFPGSYVASSEREIFLMPQYAIGFAIWGWLLWDYKLLQINSLYVKTLGLSIGVFFYGLYLGSQFDYLDNGGLIKIGTTLPAIFLLLQKPLRIAFKAMMKREPIVDKPAPSFPDFIYIFILLITTLVIPFWIMK